MSRNFLGVFLVFVVLCVHYQGFCQTSYIANVQHFTTTDGLSHRHVTLTFQDSYGFIWVGTRYGLNRFDGHEFQLFTAEKDGLEANQVSFIAEDDQGWLWVFPDLAMYMRDIHKDISFVNVQTNEVSNVAKRFGQDFEYNLEEITSVVSGVDRTLFCALGGDLVRFRNGTFEKIQTGDERDWVVLDYTPNHTLLGIRDYLSDTIELFELDTLGNELYSHRAIGSSFYQLLQDFEERLWHVSEGEFSFIKAGEKPTPFAFSDRFDLQETNAPYKKKLYFDKAGRFWYKDDKQCLVFEIDPESEDVTLIADLGASFPEMVKQEIQIIQFDNYNNAWIATAFGFYKVQINPSSFTNYLNISRGEYSVLDAVSCRGLLVQDDQLIVNTVGTDQHLVNLKSGSEQVREEGHLYYPILPEKNGGYLTASELLVFYSKSGEPEVYNWDDPEGLAEWIWSLHRDPSDGIWLGLAGEGLARLEGNSLRRYQQYNGHDELASSSIYHFLPWDDQHALVSSSTGIHVLNYEQGIIQYFGRDRKESLHIPVETVHHLHRDKEDQNVLWAASDDGGLLRMEFKESQFELEHVDQFTTADGLSNNVLYAIYEDDHQNLWITSDYGIIRFHKHTHQPYTYTEDEGIPFNEFNRISHYQAEDGTLYFGTMNGVTSFHPDRVLDISAERNDPLRITKYQQFRGDENRLIDLTANIVSNPEIVLQPGDQFFVLNFALLEFQDANLIRYSYQLEGESDDWIPVTGNQLRLGGLSYGDFTLNIRAQAASGQFAKSMLSIPVQMIKPIYLRWWFLLFSGVVVMLFLFLFYKRRTSALLEQKVLLEKTVTVRTAQVESDKKVIEEQAQELRNLDELKSRFFANVSHELRTPLTLIMGPVEATLKDKDLSPKTKAQLEMVQRNGERLNKMVNEILDLTKLDAGKLEVQTKHTVWYTFLRNSIASFESMANQKGINYQFQYEGNKYLQVQLDQQKVEIILLNLLSNSMKFTAKGGAVGVHVTDEGDFLKIMISDTGKGISEEDLPFVFDRFYQSKGQRIAVEGGTGIGLALTKEFVQLMDGKIDISSVVNEGTSITISLPKKEVISQLSDDDAQLIYDQEAEEQDQNEALTTLEDQAVNDAPLETLMLVEDNHDLQTFIGNLLGERYKVIMAENGQIGLDKLADLSKANALPALIITDIMMPIMDGYQLIENIKSSERLQSIPIIALTARVALDDKLKALRIGVDDYLTKPFVQEELFARISNLVENAKNRVIQPETEVEVSTTQVGEKGAAEMPEEELISEEAQAWLATLEEKVLDHIEDSNYNISQLSFDLAVGERHLLRKVKEMVGMSTSQYIKTIRLTQARKLLEDRTQQSVKAVAYSVGLRDVENFSKQFKQRFGKSPSAYLD